jgi:dTDP-4-dehydrorhamnose reductase
MGAGRNIIIIGAGSLVGRYLYRRAGPERAKATFHRQVADGAVRFDATAMPPARLAEIAAGCSHAVILIANSDPDDCARFPEAAHRLNVEAIQALIDQCDRQSVVPVFASTEAVFDGERGLYREGDAAAPLMTYARQKLVIEDYLAQRGRPYLIVRLSRVVTTDPADNSLFSAWLRQIAEGQTIRCAHDHIFSPIHAEDVADAILALIDGGSSGLFHLGGPDALTRLTMLERLLAEYTADVGTFSGNLTPCRMSDFPTLEPRPRDISLRSDKLIGATAVTPRSVETICRQLLNAARTEKLP